MKRSDNLDKLNIKHSICMRRNETGTICLAIVQFTGCNSHQTVTTMKSFIYSLELTICIEFVLGTRLRPTYGNTLRDPTSQCVKINILNTNKHDELAETNTANGQERHRTAWRSKIENIAVPSGSNANFYLNPDSLGQKNVLYNPKLK